MSQTHVLPEYDRCPNCFIARVRFNGNGRKVKKKEREKKNGKKRKDVEGFVINEY